MTKQTKILTGLLAGAALGAVVALVIATDKNDELKGKVSDWFCDLLASSKDKLSTVGSLVKDNLAKVNA
ncbi:YtxH domain-containing protein [Pedobacter sp. LMG 31464]|uniref:YtxH domain-containing protein n=1 Tax=Pedobacter planticolens TaxID=2679964 RepID=A0A923DYG7_9SPHI|nr:YtxH domain-containing protein [Pedobacter planticolens]MBB2146389.1 YtxH domain-containing protein [Pedobacter planticolens]